MIFVFESNKEETNIIISIVQGDKRLELGNRKHNVIIYHLAKKRARDILKNEESLVQGYIFKDWLYELIHPDDAHSAQNQEINLDYTTINQHFSRFKKLVNQKLTNTSSQELIEHRTLDQGSEVRFIPERIKIIQSGSVLYNTCLQDSLDSELTLQPDTINTANADSTIVDGCKSKNYNIQNHQSTLSEPFKEYKLSQVLIMIAAVSFLILSFAKLWLNDDIEKENTNKKKYSFVFLEPTFTKNSAISNERQIQLREKLHQAIFSYAKANTKVDFIQIVNDKYTPIRNIAKEYSVDHIISANVDCNTLINCSFSFKQYENKKAWQVGQSFNLPLSINHLNEVFWGVQFKLDAFYPQHNKSLYAPPQGVDSDSFGLFIAIYSQWQQTDINVRLLNQLKGINEMFPNWDFAIKTYHNMLKDMYLYTKDNVYLHQLELSIKATASQINDPTHTTTVYIFLDRVRMDYHSAMKKIATLYQYNINKKFINYQYGLIYQQQKKWLEITSLYKSIAVDELNFDEFRLIASTYLNLHEYKIANEVINEYLILYPDCKYAMRAKVKLDFIKGNLKSALKQSIELNYLYKNDSENMSYQAFTYYNLGKADVAYQLLIDNVSRNPMHINRVDDLGRFELLMGYSDKAKITYEAVIRLSSDSELKQNPLTMAFAYAATGQSSFAKQIITNQVAELNQNKYTDPLTALRIAEFYAIFDDINYSLNYIDVATEIGLSDIHFMQEPFKALCNRDKNEYKPKKQKYTEQLCN